MRANPDKPLWRSFRRLALLPIVLAACSSADHAVDTPISRPYEVGYRILNLPYPDAAGDQHKPLAVAVWYPTATPAAPHHYGGPTHGRLAVNGAPPMGDDRYPLLVFSHGYGGGALSSVFLAEALAARGWIVACPDHHDAVSAVRLPEGRVKDLDRLGLLRTAKAIAASGPRDRDQYRYRLLEMQATLDVMISGEEFGDLVDAGRVAVGGHSFGGYAAIGISGALAPYHDPHVRALLLFSTGAGGYLYTTDELAEIRVPTMLFIGEDEVDQRRGSATILELSEKIFHSVSAAKYFLEIKGGNHFTFNNRFSDGLFAARLSGTEQQFELIRRYSAAFLENHVVGESGANTVLQRADPGFSRYVINVQIK